MFLAFIFSNIIHLKLIFVHGAKYKLRFFFHIQLFQHHLLKNFPLPTGLLWIFVRNQITIKVGVFWAPCSIPLIYLSILIAAPHLVVVELWSCYEVESSNYDFKIVLDILRLLHFQRTFRNSLIFKKKKKKPVG